jgi:hypothetical protein
MASNSSEFSNGCPDGVACIEWAPLLVIAAAIAIIHLVTNGRYGFHRDELQFLSEARHLDWGFVAYPAQPPTTIIALGIRPEEADAIFTGCRLAGRNGNSESIHSEELDDHPFIFVCGPPRKPWAEVWKEHKDFG